MAEQEKPREEKTSRENFWDSTRKTLNVAAAGAQRYTRMVQKKINLAVTQRKIPAVHAELGKLIDDLHAKGETRFLENGEVVELLGKLDHLRQMVAALEGDLEQSRRGEPETPEGTSSH
ncbi:MAG: hypothetical protein GX751_02290 [Desulfuromonadaceae bacterium]|nr:hypothetical protein [Desulfuromonadaceae bacterium]